MDSKDWKALGKTLLNKGLPLLGTVIGGPAGAALGSAAALISSITGESPDDPVAMEMAIRKDPSLFVALKKLESDHQVELRKLAIKQEQIYLDDVQSARHREVNITTATGKKDIGLYALAWTVVLGFLATIVVLGVVENPFTDNQVGFILLGALAAGFGTVLNYFFGSSRGSKDKTSLVSELMAKFQKGSV